ncbi:hypothetical protein QYF36_014916 [Acer negundo]|nr:hypothetical protein QYF36_014916 [Acer negundo]
MQKQFQEVVVEGKWDSLLESFPNDEADEAGYYNPRPTLMTVAKDSAFHIAVHSKSEKPLKQLLDLFANNYDAQILTSVLNTTNAYENTVLHEAAINHNIKAVKLLVGEGYVTPRQLLKRNESGQTPLFKAAAFGSTKVVKYLASRPNQTIASAGYKKLEDAHRINNDGFSILHAAVLGENFGTALELLKLDKELAGLTTENGMTSLHLLTNLRSAFTKKYSDRLLYRLLYFCIPTGDYDNYDDADTVVPVKYDFKVGDNIGEDVDKVGDNQTDHGSLPIDDDDDDVETPLLAATRTGVTKLVKKILKKHPQAVEHVSHKMQNILHLAASYRRREIFQLVKKMEIPTRRLIMGIDKEGYTVLHHVADTTNFTEGTRPGPAYQLQEELEWFKVRVCIGV